jgi:hypothetical protein
LLNGNAPHSFNAATIGDAVCLKDGTRLVVPESDYQRGMIRDWLATELSSGSDQVTSLLSHTDTCRDTSIALQQTRFWLGLRGVNATAVVTAKE